VKINKILKSFIPVTEGLGKMLGEDYEVVLHDAKNPENSILHIENASLSGRKKGGPLTDLGLFLIQYYNENKVKYLVNYNANANNKKLRATTLFINDENDDLIGFLCINYDITKAEKLKMALFENEESINYIKKLLNQMTETHDLDTNYENKSETIPKDFEELIDDYIHNAQKKMGKSISELSRSEKIEFISILDKRGFFLLKGSVEELAKKLGNSKFTIYAYLREIKS
jgi:predicted transcriptional regulator YheO